MKEQVEKVLGVIREALVADGGDLELVEITPDNVVRVRLKGACAGCPGAQMTLRFHVERILKEQVPEVKAVEAV
jgi:Fe-S cluster biogenesis protein NfuA